MLVRILLTKLFTVVFFTTSLYASPHSEGHNKILGQVRESLWYQGIHSSSSLNLGEEASENQMSPDISNEIKEKEQNITYPEELIRSMQMV